MTRFIPAPLLGILMFILLVVDTLLMALPLYVIALIKYILPMPKWRRFWDKGVVWFAQLWAKSINLWVRLLLPIRWDEHILSALDKRRNYLITSNHQSWNDIVVAICSLGGKVPFFRFFLKDNLKYVPVLGLVWMALDYPFMKRYSKEQLAKNPHLKGKDLETTRIACEKYTG